MKKLAKSIVVAFALVFVSIPAAAVADGSGSGSAAVLAGSGSATVVDVGSAAAPPVVVTPPKEGDSETTVATTTETKVTTVDPNDTNTLLEILIGNFKSGCFGLAAIAAVLLLVGFIRKIEAVKKNKWLSWGLNFLACFAVTLTSVGVAGTAFTGAVIWNAVIGALAAAGALELIRDLAAKYLFGKKTETAKA